MVLLILTLVTTLLLASLLFYCFKTHNDNFAGASLFVGLFLFLPFLLTIINYSCSIPADIQMIKNAQNGVYEIRTKGQYDVIYWNKNTINLRIADIKKEKAGLFFNILIPADINDIDFIK